MRIMWRAWGLGALVVLGLALSNGMLFAEDGPVVHVKAQVADGNVRLDIQGSGPFEYTTFRPSANLYVLDLTGVSAGDPAGVRVVPSDLIKSYRVVSYSSGNRPVVRIEILLNQGIEPSVERTDSQDLVLSVARDPNAPSAIAKSDTAKPAAAKVDAPKANTAKSNASQANVATTVVKTQERETIVPTAAKTAGENSAATVPAIQQVNLAQDGSNTDVNIVGSGPLNYHATRLENPDRIVLDFTESHLKTSVKHIASNLDPVREIRLAQFSPEVSRVVIDLRQAARYDITSNDNKVTVAFSPNPSSAGFNRPATSASSSNVTTTKSAARPRAAATTAQLKTGQVPAPAAELPVGLTQPASALATPAPKQPQPQEASVPQAATEIAAASPAAAEPVAQSTVSAAPAPVVSPTSVPEPSPRQVALQTQVPLQAPQVVPVVSNGNSRFAGEPISVNLKDVDLRDFFRLIHEISGLNVVVDPSVKGTLTIVLDDVPWDQALDIVLHNNDLDKQLDGNVLRIATKDTLRKEAEQNRDLARAQAEAADVVTTTRRLSYAKATSIAATLKKFLSSRGDILADDRSNTLIIRDVPTTFPVIDNLLRQLDRKSQQVEIEARVVAANRTFSRDIGSQLAAAGAAFSQSTQNIAGGNTTVGTSTIYHTPPPPLSVGTPTVGQTYGQLPLLTNLSPLAPTSGMSYIFQSANFALDYVISAAESRGVGKLLSKPKVITQNNEKATVKQGTKIPVQTVVNNTVSVQFVDAVLELDVTPQITADGTVYMDVTVENDQIDQAIPRVQGIPAIDTQSAETKVTVLDGATVVIGGIIVNQQQTSIDQVPLVGSVPILGNLFKHLQVSSSSQELLFFLTPRILPM